MTNVSTVSRHRTSLHQNINHTQMTGSIALDVVIGLIFIYLLYSLLATVIAEIIAIHLGLRARNLQQAIRRMLEDSPQTSEVKILAFLRHISLSIRQIFTIPEGPATCVFYHLPNIKYMGRNTFYSKPSYISNQNFSSAIMEIFRRYGGHGAGSDLQRIQRVLNGELEYPGILKEIKAEINKRIKIDPEHPEKKINYTEIREIITAKVTTSNARESLDEAQLRLLAKIKKLLNFHHSDNTDKMIVYKIDELLNLFGHETRSHLKSLLEEADNDLQKFRTLLERWFDETMDRATDWYKQKIQFVLLLVGLILALWFNANTLVIVKKLSIDKDTRDQLVHMTSEYAKDPFFTLPEKLKYFTDQDSLYIYSARKARLDTLYKIRTQLQQQMNDANGLLGIGWPDLPDSLNLVRINKEDSLKSIAKTSRIYYQKINLAINKGGKKSEIQSKDTSRFIVYYGDDAKYVVQCLIQNTVWQKPNQYKGYNKSISKIKVDNGFLGRSKYIGAHLFSAAFWGYLLTAIAISLGAPFWFDLLNKLMQVRGVLKNTSKIEGTPSAPTSNPT